jgi:hypothetical protein
MNKTRGNLKPAAITNLETKKEFYFMFNPEHYTIQRQNTYHLREGLRVPPPPQFKRLGRPTLTLSSLYFDTYETGGSLTKITNQLWELMSPPDANDPASTPPEIEFRWGTFSFKAVVCDLSIKFTLFDKDGEPLRAEATISFIQTEGYDAKPHQNPTSGGGPLLETRKIIEGDRLDLIAAEVYNDATEWRRIAAFNGIRNPKRLRPGQIIMIPPL